MINYEDPTHRESRKYEKISRLILSSLLIVGVIAQCHQQYFFRRLSESGFK